MEHILLNFGLILIMETIEAQTSSQINFDNYEVSNNSEKISYMEFGVTTKYVLGPPEATQIGLEDYDHQTAAPPPLRFDRGQRFNGFCCCC